ncbi:MAG: hypothetical protein E5V92_01975 [Mesorhizobium sp.]|nr:hypothetical protein EJ067_30480 [Mesorhizobium sp. M1D.F.Ca.ET.043.01.1.1]RWA96113.1 MAG: hypothetical protein EOQ32_00395 [Mesorhizobium sp.]TJW90392.1 MAG: hypothetical protein E5V92_01975 [Mesorhizobium sp.]
MVMFEPLDLNGGKRAELHRVARLEMLHARILKRMSKLDDAADQVEQAATALIEATRQPAVDRPIMPRAASLHIDAAQTLGL